MLTEQQFHKYQCNDYLSAKFKDGYYDNNNYLQLILAHEHALVGGSERHLIIGHAGCDGIEFCYRVNRYGIWAYFPIEEIYELKAETIEKLIEGYCNGSICV